MSAELKLNGEFGDYIVMYDGRPNPFPVTHESFEMARDRTYRTWEELPPVPAGRDSLHPDIRIYQREYLDRLTAV